MWEEFSSSRLSCGEIFRKSCLSRISRMQIDHRSHLPMLARAKNLKLLDRDVDLLAFAKSNGNAVRMLALVTELSSPNRDGNHKELLISASCRGATKRFDIQKDSRPTGTSQKAELKVMRARQSSFPLNNHAISTSTTFITFACLNELKCTLVSAYLNFSER